MGAWGPGYFEDDAAVDFMRDIEESREPKRMLLKTFDSAIKKDYIESHEGSAVIVAAAYVDRQVNGTKFSAMGTKPLEIDSFPERNPDQNFMDLKEKAVAALKKVLAENSEIRELWAENDDDYTLWKDSIEQLMGRLAAG
jgi:Domain of unknown function (DUF4259)